MDRILQLCSDSCSSLKQSQLQLRVLPKVSCNSCRDKLYAHDQKRAHPAVQSVQTFQAVLGKGGLVRFEAFLDERQVGSQATCVPGPQTL